MTDEQSRETPLRVLDQEPIDWDANPELLNRLLLAARFRIEQVLRKSIFGDVDVGLVRYHTYDPGLTVNLAGQCVRIDITPVPDLDSEPPTELPKLRMHCTHDQWQWKGGYVADPGAFPPDYVADLDLDRYCIHCKADLEPEWEMVKQHRPYSDCGSADCAQCELHDA
jgi:hypothetical protein